ncbi:MAG: MBL fold metallo-hydrolase [Burkholderiales bacterium]|nr:MBL fold metallo-hydrolase [Burkholderiales bacterium]
MRFAALASGSGGNCWVAQSARSCVLVDCGLAPRETARRLARLGLAPGDVSAVLLTHEHGDHAASAFAFAAEQRIPVWLTLGTLRALEEARATCAEVAVRIVEARVPLALGDFEVLPFAVPHDAREPVQYVLSDGARRLGLLTDLGSPTASVAAALGGCDALVVECNHDETLLARGPYPPWLKARIAGPFGHLSNAAAAALLAAIDRSRLQHVVCAHLSEKNNRPELARAALAAALGGTEDGIDVATQNGGLDWRTVE